MGQLIVFPLHIVFENCGGALPVERVLYFLLHLRDVCADGGLSVTTSPSAAVGRGSVFATKS